MTPAEYSAQFEKRQKARWPGLTCPIITVTEGVDVEKLLREAKQPIMVCRMTINNIDHAMVDRHLGPHTS